MDFRKSKLPFRNWIISEKHHQMWLIDRCVFQKCVFRVKYEYLSEPYKTRSLGKKRIKLEGARFKRVVELL